MPEENVVVRQEAFNADDPNNQLNNQNNQLVPGSDEHKQAMAQKFDNAQNLQQSDNLNNNQNAPVKPSYVPDKFWNAETGQVDMEGVFKSYAALENKQAQNANNVSNNNNNDDTSQNNEANDNTTTPPKIDMQAFTNEYMQNGKLSDETYTKLEAAGFDKGTVDSHIAGQVALAEKHTTELVNIAGGKEGYDKMIEWAVANISAEEQAAYDKAIAGDIQSAKLTVQGLFTKYQATVGTDPNLMKGNNVNANLVSGFTSKAQIVEAMKDPRYAKDPAYREEVVRKIQNAPFEW